MSQYLYRIRPARPAMLSEGPTPAEAQIVGEHFEYLKGLTARGVVLLAGRTLTAGDDTFGIVVYEAASDDEARALMASDPAVARGVMRAELWPFRVALMRGVPGTAAGDAPP